MVERNSASRAAARSTCVDVLLRERPRGISRDGRSRGDRLDDHRSRRNRASVTDIRQHHRGSTYPALLADYDFHKLTAIVGQPALRIPFVLLASAEDLHGGAEARASTNRRASNHAIWPHSGPTFHGCLRVGKEGAEADFAVARATA